MRKFEDKLGILIDTALQPIDDDPGFDDKGSTALLSPETDDASEETEDDLAFQGLREAGLSPGEAQRTVDTMRPLDEDETDILATTPALDGLTKVDDSERQQWLRAVAKEGSKGIDRVFDDATYGEPNMNRSEERMERKDVDSTGSWWKHLNPISQLKSAVKVATYPMRKLGSLAMHFVPGRDAGKATIVRNTYKKLWYEHANWLAQQDANAGLPLKPRANYEYVAKLWAKDQLTRYNLPVSLATDSSGGSPASRKAQLDHMILGSEGMGAWFWPFSWFQKSSTTVINNTADKRADAPPDGQQDASAPQYQNVQPPVDDGSSQMPASYGPPANYGPPPGYSTPSDYGPPPDSYQGVQMHGWNGFIKTRLAGVFGSDSLGAYATQILGHDNGAAQPAKDNPHAERVVKTIALKLKTGKPIGPGEVGLLSSAAKEGNVSAQQVIAVLKARGAVVSGDSSGLDPWMYKLNPSYWFASSRKKEFITAERKGWKENAALQKQLAKQQVDLDAAEKAAQAEQAVEASKAQAAATEARLKEIQTTLKGQMSGSFLVGLVDTYDITVGHEKITPISQVVVNALDKAGKKESAGRLYNKIKSGQSLDKNELHEARQIAKIIGRMKVVHGDLVNSSDETLAMHGAFVGACVLGAIDAARAQNDRDHKFAVNLSQKIASGQPVTRPERQALIQTLKSQTKLRGFTKSLVSGRAFVGCKQAKTWTKGAFVGAAKAMSDNDKKMLAVIVKLAKVGNPRAQKALTALRQSGEIAGDSMGLSIGKFFHYATAPIWLPAKGIYKGEQALFGQKGGGGSPEQQRLAMMAAAAKRRQAAEARAAAADAQSEAEQRAQLAIANAADAEADAKDAEALAKEEAMKTKEVQADPSSLAKADDESGEFCGTWVGFVGKGTRDAKIVVAANQNTPTGIKIRAGNRLYKKAKAGDPKSIAAIQAMTAKANAGDPQALRDVNAIKAGKAFQAAQKRAQRKQAAMAIHAQRKKAAMANREARRLRVVAFQKAYESRLANKMCRIQRTRELKKHWKVERMAAAGNPKAKAYVSKQVVLAKKGDKKAKARVQAMQQGRLVRQKVRTPRDIRNMKEAERFARGLARNNPKTIRQYEILKAAANKGNPNAIRAIDRIMLAAMVVSTINTGVVATTHKGKKGAKRDAAIRNAQKQVASAKRKAATRTASREELAAGAKAAHALGDNATAGRLAQQAASAPSATETIKKKAAIVAAAEAGNPEAKNELAANLADAKQGGVGGIKELGKTMAVDTADKIEKGEPIPQTMKDAFALNERIKAGDPVATKMAKEITEQATSPDPSPDATMAAGALVGAQIMDKSLAAKPKAKAELMSQVAPPIPEAERSAAAAEVEEIMSKTNAGTVTAAEGQRGVALAMRLGKPKVAAMISAKAPPPEEDEFPLSSLPDQTLAPITGALSLIKESVKALAFATPNPIANYREGVASRGGVPLENLPTVMGWSAFDSFAKKISLPGLAMMSLPLMAITSITSLFKKPKEQKIIVQMAPPPATPAAPAVTATAKAAGMGADSFQDLVARALKSKKMSKDDFNKAVTMNLPANADDDTKKASGVQLLDYLKSKNVTVGGTFVGTVIDTRPDAKERTETKLRKGIENLRVKHWKKPLPIIIDVSLLRGLQDGHEVNMIAAYEKLGNEGTVKFSNKGPRLLITGLDIQSLNGTEKVEDGHIVDG